jgi:hypothetical protein
MVTALIASRGGTDPMAVLAWHGNFLKGRFTQPPAVFSPKDGISNAIQPAAVDAGGNLVFHKTWAAVGTATRAKGLSNTDTVRAPGGWDRSQGVFGQIGMGALAFFWKVTGDAQARAAYETLARLNAPRTAKADFERDPNFAVTIPGIYGGH